ELIAIAREILDQHLAVILPALIIAQGIELQDAALPGAEATQELNTGRDHFDIALRLLDAEELDASLMELPHAALLRPLIAEHRSGIKIFQRQILGEATGDQRTRNTCCAFR